MKIVASEMAKYLDPKADLTFKRVFGEHPNLVASLLNSLLPLPAGEEIADIEYMSPERVPRTSIGKNSIVDVFCKTKDGRKFIVEMQMCWTADFRDRALFNSAKVYVEQLMVYDLFWDAVRVAKTLASAPERSYKAGLKEGKLETARQMKADGMAVETIAKYTGLSAAEIARL